MGMSQGEFGADGPADRAARVAEALDAELVEGGQQPGGELGHGGGRMGGGAAVAGEVEAEDAPVAGELGYLAVPHVPGGAQRRSEDERGPVLGAIGPVLKCLRLAHPKTVSDPGGGVFGRDAPRM
ncbi:hypothetical protein SVIO_081130 [Streptomyces violaceusniger]|uniref:Uncharacterized protein n=1 Tax=Streptomyces violaceusniger TaxID=68280 RepID=A0A4D4LEG1_STRVO|nr:hypothetical protein SVIO_081130 [Streptomyces violaceusniger]